MRRLFRSTIGPALLIAFVAATAAAQQVKRIVIMKIDGLPSYFVDEIRRQRDPQTGKSMLPWIDEVFYKNGTRLANFYVRGMSLSAPSWGLLDTGQHLQIKGNVEFDRYTLHPYDYLNVPQYYIGYGLNKAVDMPAVEVLDGLRLPIMSDAFAADRKYTSPQLYQRAFEWSLLAGGFINTLPRNINDGIDEWTLGLDMSRMTIRQSERDIVGKLAKRREIDFFDYFDESFDHASHHNNDLATRISTLKELDRSVGHIWTAIEESPRADETALVLVSDHGFNSSPKVYSQGFNLVKMLADASGGGHHVITKRRLLMSYSVRGLYPLIPLIRTSSSESYYLKGEAGKYPTALVDFDGNERSSIHLRNSNLNVLHILLQQLQNKGFKGQLRDAAAEAVLDLINRRRKAWQSTSAAMGQELDALSRWVDAAALEAERLAKLQGLSDDDRRNAKRLRVAVGYARRDLQEYREYLASLARLMGVTREGLVRGRFQIEQLVMPDAMGDGNSINDLQNYVVGPRPDGLKLTPDGKLDIDGSFVRIDYPSYILDRRVRNNVQPGISNRPVEFIAMRVPLEGVRDKLDSNDLPDDDPVLLYAGPGEQVLILTRTAADGGVSFRYLPIANFSQDENGRVTFEAREIRDGLPLRYFEDPELAVAGDRAAWLGSWHTEPEWLRAVHRTTYSNGIIGVNEQMDRHLFGETSQAGDAGLIARFRQRQRMLTEADILVEAADHWNFDVRGFNPGGNHGSFFRASTNSTFMIAGGDATGIPRGLTVDEPYDSLSFMPTILRLMGRVDDQNRPSSAMAALGFKPFPGRVVRELVR